MIFWRKRNNPEQAEQEARDAKLLHPNGEPELEPSTDTEVALDPDVAHTLSPSESEIIDDLSVMPAPTHTRIDDMREASDLSDHTFEGGWFSRLRQGLSKSTNKLGQNLSDWFTKDVLDAAALEQLEEALLAADLGPQTTARVIADFSKKRFAPDDGAKLRRAALADTLAAILAPVEKPLLIQKPAHGPFVILVCGVNGAGKTTTIGKIAHDLHYKQKKSVMLAAGDTFRAAAVEQLQEWAKRSGSVCVAKDIGADSAALAYEAYETATQQNMDVLIIDTAGRLQNKANLMAELEKIQRVLKKHTPDIPHACLLVLDATTGQNAFSQVEAFSQMAKITGLVVTKLDGSAKGGVLVGLAERYKIPVHFIGVGEQIEDLQPFAAQAYASALIGVDKV